MNAKVILYLFGMEWRRLRIWLGIFWLLLLLEALPYLGADFDLLSSFAKLLGKQYDHFSGAGDLKELVWSDVGNIFPMWMPVLMSMNGAASIAVIIVCSLIGMEVLAGIRLRPVRIREEVASKVLALGVFVILPVAIIVALNLAMKGLGLTTALGEAGHSALVLAPMAGALALFGRLCGTFWRWVGGMVGFMVTIVILPMLGLWQVPLPKFDLWGVDGNGWRVGAATFSVLTVLMLFKGKARSFRPVVVAWPLMVAALMVGFYSGKAADAKRLKRDGLPDVEGLQVEVRNMQGGIQSHDRRSRWIGVSVSGEIKVTGVPEGYFATWDANGRMANHTGGSCYSGIRTRLATLRFADEPQVRELPTSLKEEALRSAMRGKGVNLPHSPDWYQDSRGANRISFNESIKRGEEQESLDRPTDFAVSLTGLVFRYRLAEDVPLDSIRETGDGRSRVRITTSQAARNRLNVDLAMMQAGDRRDSIDLEPQVVIWDPESGIGAVLRRSRPIRPRLLAGCWFRLARYQTSGGAPGVPDDRFGQMNHSKVRVLVYMPEILGLAEKKLEVEDVVVRKPRGAGNWGQWDARVSKIDANSFFERYPAGRPDPATCTDEEAGRWVMRVLTQVPPYESEWPAKEVAYYVPRHAGMLLRFPENVLHRSGMVEALTTALPQEKKENLFDAMGRMESGYGFSSLYQVARKRGWGAEASKVALRRKFQEDNPNGVAMGDLVTYVEPGRYPELIKRLDGNQQWGFYLKLRELPGIEPALSEAIRLKEQETRARGETDPDAYAIAAAHGSREALRTLLSNIELSDRLVYSMGDASQVILKATYVPSVGAGWPAAYVARVKKIGADGLEWNPFLRLWTVKQSQP